MTARPDLARCAEPTVGEIGAYGEQDQRAGRMCPADYRYPSTIFDREPEIAADVLYVAGGLYGNLVALDAIERLAAQEGASIVFNGDFHWFDAEPSWFRRIERRVARHLALRGNVETEVARPAEIGAGCGCAYPPSVAEGVVRRSNEMLLALRRTAKTIGGAADRLAALPMHLIADIGRLRVAIVHGDAASLAGWSFTPDRLDAPDALHRLAAVQRSARVDAFASTHTCLAVLRDLELPAGRLTVINNGAAGMPNFSGSRFGLITRIGTTPSPHRPLYGVERDGVHVDAIALDRIGNDFLDRFRTCWPPGSAAHASYLRRLMAGPDHTVERAFPSRRTTTVTRVAG